MRHIPTKLVTAWNLLKFKLWPFKASFIDAASYWESRYKAGGNSGAGSWNDAAQYKANTVNYVIDEYEVPSVIEFGCGDGNQLSLYKLPEYIGFDVSQTAIDKCSSRFGDDPTKKFLLADRYSDQQAALSISIDVIYHLVNNDDFSLYMKSLINSSTSLVLIYSTNTDRQSSLQAPHVKHRKFSEWIAKNTPEWQAAEISSPFTEFRKSLSEHDATFHLYKKVKQEE